MNINYKDLLERFCFEKGFSGQKRQRLVKPYLYEKKLFELTVGEYQNLVVHEMCKNSKDVNYLIRNLSYLTSFFDWCCEQDIIHANPFAMLSDLQLAGLLPLFLDKANVTVFTDELIGQVVSRLEKNKERSEVLVRAFYEGIRTPREFAGLRLRNIAFGTGVITLAGRSLQCSAELIAAIERYRDTESVWGNSRQGSLYPAVQISDFLLKVSDKDGNLFLYDPDEPGSEEKYVGNCINRIVNYMKWIQREMLSAGMELNMSYDCLFKSGMLHRLREQLRSLSDEEFCSLFLDYGEVAAREKLKTLVCEFVRRYGVNDRWDNIKKSYQPYIVKSEYYHG